MASHKKSEQIRLQIVQSTDDLLYHKGYNRMSFSDIANASGVPRGNLNYHFKTKQEVLNSVIEYRLQQTKLMLEDWDNTIPNSYERIKRFIQILDNEQSNICQFGCPMGSLNTELGKEQPDLQNVTREQFNMFRAWLKNQFSDFSPGNSPDRLAVHLLVLTQGVATMSHIYTDKKLIKYEIDEVFLWLDNL